MFPYTQWRIHYKFLVRTPHYWYQYNRTRCSFIGTLPASISSLFHIQTAHKTLCIHSPLFSASRTSSDNLGTSEWTRPCLSSRFHSLEQKIHAGTVKIFTHNWTCFFLAHLSSVCSLSLIYIYHRGIELFPYRFHRWLILGLSDKRIDSYAET